MNRRTNNVVLAVVFLAAIAASFYLLGVSRALEAGTFRHSICDVNATFSCSTVNESKYAKIAGVPVSVFSIGLYAALFGLLVVGKRKKDAAADGLIVLGMTGSVAASVVMAFISSTLVGAYCLFCIGLYLLSFVGFALVLQRAGGFSAGVSAGLASLGKLPAGAAGVAAVVFLVAGGASQTWYVLGGQASTPQHGEGDGHDHSGQAANAFDRAAFQQQWLALPRIELPVGPDEMTRGGGPDAPVTFIEYADVECPYCQKTHHALKPLLAGFGDKVRFVFRNYPLDQSCNRLLSRPMHLHACNAARSSECARQQGKGWEMLDLLFGDPDHIAESDLQKKANKLGLDMDAWRGCYEADDTRTWLEGQVNSGRALGLQGTPAMFINGRPVEPYPELIVAAIEAALSEAVTP